ncbi:glycosyl transferase family 90-domain-containing protein [Obelidium mucronatum]|nr:glycosyl transferase family 90-domain-containing protein [Obelidium mucronatum]
MRRDKAMCLVATLALFGLISVSLLLPHLDRIVVAPKKAELDLESPVMQTPVKSTATAGKPLDNPPSELITSKPSNPTTPNQSHVKEQLNPTTAEQWNNEYTQRFNRTPPESYLKWFDFAKKHKCPTALDPYYLQIYKDLDYYFKKGYIHPESLWPISQYKVNQFDGKRSKPFQFVINGTPGSSLDFDEPRVAPADDPFDVVPYTEYADIYPRNACFRREFDTPSVNDTFLVSKGQKLRDLHGFFLNPDTFVVDNFRAPILSQSKPECFEDIMMPLGYHTDCGQKQTALFWRGSTTGGSYRQNTHWRKYPRTMLAQWAQDYEKKHPGSAFDAGKGQGVPKNVTLGVDVSFMWIVQSDNVVKSTIEKEFGLRTPISFEQTMQFKYLLVVDGNSWPSRLQSYLHTNSVILYNGIFTDFFNKQLIPWVHYVPVKLDFSDLNERLEWLVANDDKAKQIAVNAKTLMKTVGSLGYVQCYTGLLMMEYQRLYGITPHPM